MIIPHPDKFGYYQVGKRKTYSKVEAVEWQRSTGQWPSWNFNDEIYKSFDWTREPDVDLWSLYKQRAREIREAYDYCVIFYSGGSDSHNLLSAWIDADCKLDEIATFHYYEGSKNPLSFMNAEVTLAALPLVQELAKTNDFKFRMIDMSQDIIDLVQNHADDYRYIISKNASPNNHAKIRWRESIKDYQNRIVAGQKVCFIWGSDKPMMGYDGRYFVRFMDVIDNCVAPYCQHNFNQGYFDELFYWTPDMPEIVCKQSHIIRKFCTTIHDDTWYQDQFTEFGYNPVIRKYLTPESIKKIIYPRWNPATFCDGKSKSFVWSDRDAWFIQGNLEASQKWRNISRKFMHDLDPSWLNDPKDYLKGIKSHCSPNYYIEPAKAGKP